METQAGAFGRKTKAEQIGYVSADGLGSRSLCQCGRNAEPNGWKKINRRGQVWSCRASLDGADDHLEMTSGRQREVGDEDERSWEIIMQTEGYGANSPKLNASDLGLCSGPSLAYSLRLQIRVGRVLIVLSSSN